MFKKLKSLFIEDDGTPEETPKKEELETPQKTPSPKAQKPIAHQTPTRSKGAVTEKFTNVLLGVLEKNNLEGFDYLEFKRSLQSLEKMPMDEATRFKSAFAMAQTMNTTPQKLVETAQFYLNVLQKEEKKFLDALNNQRAKQIGNKEQNIDQLAKVIQQKSAQIKKLTQEIDAHQKQMENMRQEISNSTVKVENTKANFDATYHILVSKISQDIDNIKKYLKS